MGDAEKQLFIEVDEYIKGELTSEVRHEFIGGQVYVMSGGSEEHNLIALNLASALRQHLSGKPCKVFMADMKVRLNIARDDVFYYPDVMVTCDPDDKEKYYKEKPTVLVEVLSPSTERLDRREKFLSYQRFASLQEYILVDQGKIEVTLFARNNAWDPNTFGVDDTLQVPSLDFNISLKAIYEDVF